MAKDLGYSARFKGAYNSGRRYADRGGAYGKGELSRGLLYSPPEEYAPDEDRVFRDLDATKAEIERIERGVGVRVIYRF